MSRRTVVDLTEGPTVTELTPVFDRGGSYNTKYSPYHLKVTYGDDIERPRAYYPTLGFRVFRNFIQPTK